MTLPDILLTSLLSSALIDGLLVKKKYQIYNQIPDIQEHKVVKILI